MRFGHLIQCMQEVLVQNGRRALHGLLVQLGESFPQIGLPGMLDELGVMLAGVCLEVSEVDVVSNELSRTLSLTALGWGFRFSAASCLRTYHEDP